MEVLQGKYLIQCGKYWRLSWPCLILKKYWCICLICLAILKANIFFSNDQFSGLMHLLHSAYQNLSWFSAGICLDIQQQILGVNTYFTASSRWALHISSQTLASKCYPACWYLKCGNILHHLIVYMNAITVNWVVCYLGMRYLGH